MISRRRAGSAGAVVTSRILFAGLVIAGAPFLYGCSSCGSDKPKASAATAPSSSSAVAAPSASALSPPERRDLSERVALKADEILAKRADVLGHLDKARDAKEGVLELLDEAQRDDPLGAAVALARARAAAASGNFDVTARAARVAAAAGAGRQSLIVDARALLGQALEKLGRPRDAITAYESALAAGRDPTIAQALKRLQEAGADEVRGAVAPSIDVHAPDVTSACAAIERDVRAGKVDLALVDGKSAEAVTCQVDLTLEVGAPTLPTAHALRVDVKGGDANERLVWVALQGGSDLSLFGPIASVFGNAASGAVNDVIVDLQQIDVLPGGAPEVVVKLVERRTLPDVALNEFVELDEARAVLLTIDRGGIQPSQEVVLSSRVVRDQLDRKAKKLPRGYAAARGLGQATEYSMKVAWGGPNSMTLTRTSGEAKPKLEGSIALFP